MSLAKALTKGTISGIKKLKLSEDELDTLTKRASDKIRKELGLKPKQKPKLLSDIIKIDITPDGESIDITALVNEFRKYIKRLTKYKVSFVDKDGITIPIKSIGISTNNFGLISPSIDQIENTIANALSWGEYGALDYGKDIRFIFTPIVKKSPSLPISRDAMLGNCFVNIIKDKLKPKRLDFWQEECNTGAVEEHIKKILKEIKCGAVIRDLLDNIWLDVKPLANKKVYNLIHHNEHIYEYKIDEPIKKQVFVNCLSEVMETNASMKVIGDPQSPYGVQINDTVYKPKTVFICQLDYQENKDKIPLNCYTLAARVFKRKMEHVQDLPRNLPNNLFEFVEAADHPSLFYTKPDQPTYEESFKFDQKGSYSNYRKSPYYTTFQLPNVPTHYYKLTLEQSNKYKKQILETAGFSQIYNLKITDKFKQVQDDLPTMHNYQVYTNMRLRAYLDYEYIEFDILRTAWHPESQDINLTLTNKSMIDGCLIDLEGDGRITKQITNSMIGKLAKNQDRSISCLTTTNEQEVERLRFTLQERIIKVEEIDTVYGKTYFITYLGADFLPKSYKHIHAYILDYQLISIMPFIVDNYSKFLSVRIDGVVLDSLPKRKPRMHEFMKPIEILKNYKAPQTISKEPKIYDTTLAVDALPDFYQNPTTSYQGKLFTNQYFDIQALGGFGKTYTLTNKDKGQLYNSIILFPTNVLLMSFDTDLPRETIDNFFNFRDSRPSHMTQQHINQYSNIIIDEGSMIDHEKYVRILKLAKNKNIYLIRGIGQIKPYGGDDNELESIDLDKLEIEDYITHQKIELTTPYRTTDVDYSSRQAKIIDLPVEDKIKVFQDRCIPSDTLLDYYQFNTKDLVLCSTNRQVDWYNEYLHKKAKKYTDATTLPGRANIPVSYTRTIKRKGIILSAKNERILLPIAKFDSKRYKLSFASTIHQVQGQTIKHNIFLDSDKLEWMPECMNVAASRTSDISKFYILEYPPTLKRPEEPEFVQEDEETTPFCSLDMDLDMFDDLIEPEEPATYPNKIYTLEDLPPNYNFTYDTLTKLPGVARRVF